jgi:hypothetical protein
LRCFDFTRGRFGQANGAARGHLCFRRGA